MHVYTYIHLCHNVHIKMATYTPSQLSYYLKRIHYLDSATNDENRLSQLYGSIHKDPLAALSKLQRRHLSTIPFGNTALHYSHHKTISLDPSDIFQKLVVNERDGYCMENSGLFYVVLRSLGFRVYTTGGRVCKAMMAKSEDDNGLFGGYGHMVPIVMIGETKYLVDVGFGSGCPTRPLPLKENKPLPSIAPAEMRLVKEAIPEFIDKSQRVWIYQIRYQPNKPWISAYCFSEVEFLPQDFGVMNFYTSQSRTSWFTQKVVCIRMILDEKEEHIEGQLVLAEGQVKRRVRGGSEIVQKLKTEGDRVGALARWFGLRLSDEEIRGIRGLVSQIK